MPSPRAAHMRALLTALLLTAAAPVGTLAAAPDGNIEWNGLSHIGRLDRRPLCPVDGESFSVRFQAFRDDLTSARVRATLAGSPVVAEAAKVGTRGRYDIWSATLPATAAAALVTYHIELQDGADLDYLSVNGVTDGPPVDGGFVVDFATLSHAPVGATRITGGGAVFKVWAPTRTSVHVRGDFNGWGLTTPMTQQGEHFVARASGVADRSQYKYFFDNAVWNMDARSRSQNAQSDRNSHIEDPLRYVWASDAFVTPDAESLVVYQLHVGTFAGRNDPLGSVAYRGGYRAVGDRAGQLAELGVNCVQVCPITEFPGDLSAGYNPITQWAPEWIHGTPDDLKYMIDRLHAHGIAVTLDIVWNHFTVNDNWMWFYDGSQTYFDSPAIDTPWGAQADFDRAAVRDYFADSALLWLEEYRFDGFRMDATSYMTIGAQSAAGWSLMQRMNDEIDRRRLEAFVVAEQLPNNAAISSPTSGGGAGFDAQYHMQFRDAVRGAILSAGLGDPNMNAVRSALLGSGASISGRKALNYFQLHDEAWPTSGGQRLVKTIDTTAPHDDQYAKGRMKLATGLLLTAPGVPALLQGDEWLEDTDFGTDPGNRIDWSKKTTYAGIFAYHQALMRLRRTLAPLRASSSIYVSRVDEGANWIAFRRFDGSGQSVMIVASFSNSPLTVRVGLPTAGGWSEVVNSQDPAYMGSGPVNAGVLATEPIAWDGFNQSVELQLPAMGLLLLAPAELVDAPAPGGRAALSLSAPWPNPGSGAVTLRFALARPGEAALTVHDLAGRQVAALARGPHAAGEHVVRWDGRGDDGRGLAPGLYLARLVTATGERTVRLARLR